ncbi:unnamed protein product [Cuscuta campestris]|uniref:RRM domain-containing protein n=1 Tax=Cuscuta campestris TaxID=132261 RepID=A0A484NGL7_9ASTE|nr:unnamed protein product [Cuscuta campestris]
MLQQLFIVNNGGDHVGYGFVEFASADEAMKAREKKNGELLCGHHVILGAAEIAPHTPLLHMYCIDHKVCYEDCLRGESLLIEEDEVIEEDEAVEGLDDFVEVPVLIISQNYESKLVGCGFVEFASAIEAKKVLINTNRMREMTGDLINLDVAKIRVAQYPLRPK